MNKRQTKKKPVKSRVKSRGQKSLSLGKKKVSKATQKDTGNPIDVGNRISLFSFFGIYIEQLETDSHHLRYIS